MDRKKTVILIISITILVLAVLLLALRLWKGATGYVPENQTCPCYACTENRNDLLRAVPPQASETPIPEEGAQGGIITGGATQGTQTATPVPGITITPIPSGDNVLPVAGGRQVGC